MSVLLALLKGITMKGPFETRTREEVLRIVAAFRDVGTEVVASAKASGRVLSADVKSPCDSPHFDRAMMDGFAVRAEDVSGASAESPVMLRVVGHVDMGRPAECTVEQGAVAELGTGAAVPEGADAVVMLEYTDRLSNDTIAVTRPVARRENVMRMGADFREGELMFQAGKRLAPKDIAALVSVGIGMVEVFRRPTVAIIPTGDELVPPQKEPATGQIRETNSAVLAALIERDGGIAVAMKIVRDDPEKLKAAIDQGMDSADMVLVSGGSSVGTRDMTLAALESFENSEILVHGIATRPGKPTIVARIEEKPIVGLPGHPVSSLVSYEVVVRSLLDRLSGVSGRIVQARSGSTVRARLKRKLPALIGRDEYVRVRFERTENELVAVPVGRSSGATSTLAAADGWILVEMNTEGLEAGEEVEVTLF